MRRWRPDPGWAGNWSMPPVFDGPVSERERAVLVAMSCEGFGPKRLAQQLVAAERIEDLWDEHGSSLRSRLNALASLGSRAIVPSDDEYPENLASIDAPPVLLYAKGEPIDPSVPRVAIVGARACTAGAARFASRLGEAFARAGLVVVSGLARGIDVAAHRGALVAGSTIAVTGTGIDVCYPPEHREIATRIVTSGTIVTEFPPGTGPRAWHFPARNRIIAGLSDALVVVEAGMSSGALITAGFALDQGRHVFACTTGPENPAGAGVRELLKDGAGLIIDADQAVEVVTAVLADQGFAFGKPVSRGERAVDLDADLRQIYDAVTEDCSVDEVAANAGLSP
ncbi:MAG: DNA-processing protein DprA, partial [Actinomycetota bacterium]